MEIVESMEPVQRLRTAHLNDLKVATEVSFGFQKVQRITWSHHPVVSSSCFYSEMVVMVCLGGECSGTDSLSSA